MLSEAECDPRPERGRISRRRLAAVLCAAVLLEPVACVAAGYFGASASRNPGVAFGLLSGAPGLAIAVSAVALAGVLWAVFRAEGLCAAARTGLAVTAGGAASNLAERLLFGAVTDWIPLPLSGHFIRGGLRFNLADVEIALGVCVAFFAFLPGTGRTGGRRQGAIGKGQKGQAGGENDGGGA